MVSKSNPLPIELTKFEAHCSDNSVNIEWTTASEKDNDYFILEKSYDGQNFNNLEVIKGAGNSNIEKHYLFNDKSNYNSDSYYRLVQVDYNGIKTVFNAISANCAENDKSISAFYDRNNNQITVSNIENYNSDITIYFFAASSLSIF